MKKDWRDKKVVIVGAARQGIALTNYFVREHARVVLTDTKSLQELRDAQEVVVQFKNDGNKIDLIAGENPLEILDDADALFISGGVPLSAPIVRKAIRDGIPVLNDTQEFLDRAPCRVIGITGSAGKTTTTTLLGRILEAAVKMQPEMEKSKVWVGGNIGRPLIDKLDEIKKNDFVVLELSSFQLEILQSSPHIAVVLNIKPDHLDRHKTMDDYVAAKTNILAHQSENDIAVLNRDDPIVLDMQNKTKGKVITFGFGDLVEGQSGAYVLGNTIYLRNDDAKRRTKVVDKPLIDLNCIKLRGKHNLMNIMAACTVATILGVQQEAISEGICGFEGVPHRLEFVREWGGAKWFNDSIATTPERALAAVEAFDEPVILLAGGRDKNLPWAKFADSVTGKVKSLILFGEAAEKIKSYFIGDAGFILGVAPDLKSAVELAASNVVKGDIVLLAPGGTSFDEFENYEKRGDYFKELVRNLS